jgi:hypothetical protein
MNTPLLANLICGSPARNHDFDFARRCLLDALYAAGDIRTDVTQTYPDVGPFDKPRPDGPDQPDRRGPWALPIYAELIRRGIERAARRSAL